MANDTIPHGALSLPPRRETLHDHAISREDIHIASAHLMDWIMRFAQHLCIA